MLSKHPLIPHGLAPIKTSKAPFKILMRIFRIPGKISIIRGCFIEVTKASKKALQDHHRILRAYIQESMEPVPTHMVSRSQVYPYITNSQGPLYLEVHGNYNAMITVVITQL